jgi:3-phosphoglycerate kinase
MSLLSQKDRKLVIEALEYYRDDTLRKEEAFKELKEVYQDLQDVKVNDAFMMELNALINWIKLEHFKNED